ncbi:MAG: glycosyltransferase family 2 protein [Patescibacteria group bacterium]
MSENTTVRPFTTVVIVTYNRREKLLRLLQSVAASDYPADRLEIIVVDNVSTDGTVAAVRQAFPSVRVLAQENNLYSAGGRNVGAAAAAGEAIFFIDDDNILDPHCISQLIEALENDAQFGLVAPLMMRYPEQDIIWCAGGRLSGVGMPYHLFEGQRRSETLLPDVIKSTDYYPNAYLVRAEIFRRGIWHDTELFPHNWNEQDYCMKVKRAGYALATVTAAVTYHDIGYSTRITRVGRDKTYDQARARILFRRLYLNVPVQWLFFFLVLFPASTLYYMRIFASQRDEKFFILLSAYLKGSWNGFRQHI